ncbi:MAG: exosortase/archaeosortase family protein [Chloroflexi bacterium]|nr:MAG: exosortase/archaeosortase family protein [Chloroflexota bacterium]TMF37612.1 MAG: exosortase/archaeosortase family protein [Chloroflexota bacterium]
MDGAPRMVSALLEHLRPAPDEPGRPDPRGGAGPRRAGRFRRARPLLCARSVSGMGGAQRPDQQRRRSVVPNAEDRPGHRPRSAPAPAAHAAALAQRQPHQQAAVGASDLAFGGATRASSDRAQALARLARNWRAGAPLRRAGRRFDARTHGQRRRQPAVSPRLGYRSRLHGRLPGRQRRHPNHVLRDSVRCRRRHDHVGMVRASRADDRRRSVELHDVLDRWHRPDQRHGQHCLGRLPDRELRGLCRHRARRIVDLDHHLRRQRRQHHQPVHRQHKRQPAAARHSGGRVAVRIGHADPQHRRKALNALRRPARCGQHRPRAAKHRRARGAARPRRPRGVRPSFGRAIDQETAVNPRERDNVNLTLIALTCALLMVLPLVTTFDDLLTAWAMQMGADNPLQAIVPVEARMVVSLLGLAGVHAAASGSHLVVWDGTGSMHTLFISWNCIGWQSLILFGVSLMSGLRGGHSVESRVQVLCIGLAGTVLLNLIRVSLVALIAATVGIAPAILFHDYGGTILFVGFLFAFWAFAQRWILRAPASEVA